jgi:hypothetical protein
MKTESEAEQLGQIIKYADSEKDLSKQIKAYYNKKPITVITAQKIK